MLESLKIATIGPNGAQPLASPSRMRKLDELADHQTRHYVGPCAGSTFRLPSPTGGFAGTASRLAGRASPRSKMLGGAATIVAIGLLALNISAVNTYAATESVPETIGMRGSLACPWVLVLALVLGRQSSQARILDGLVLVGVGFDALNAMMFLTTLTLMSFACDVSIQQTVPLLMVVYACFVLGDRLGWRQIAAIVVVVAGALFLAKPGLESLGWGAVIAFGAAIALATRNCKTAATDPPILPRLAAVSAGLVLSVSVAAFSLRGDRTAPPISLSLDGSRGISTQDVRTVGRQTVVRLQIADGL